ncbi:MAG: hypothetical protein MOGMAGMI_00649 [Candidatus Omnitrophica bacterium]|nr:hypothetical protein [Candidatus Omnitrophota bacterium]
MQSMNGHKSSATVAGLQEAAQAKKEEMAKLVSQKLDEIKGLLRGTVETGKAQFEKAVECAEDGIGQGKKQIQKTAKQVDREIKKNPWPVIGAAAALSLFAGLVIGWSARKYRD